jgi:hypothetical protein
MHCSPRSTSTLLEESRLHSLRANPRDSPLPRLAVSPLEAPLWCPVDNLPQRPRAPLDNPQADPVHSLPSSLHRSRAANLVDLPLDSPQVSPRGSPREVHRALPLQLWPPMCALMSTKIWMASLLQISMTTMPMLLLTEWLRGVRAH